MSDKENIFSGWRKGGLQKGGGHCDSAEFREKRTMYIVLFGNMCQNWLFHTPQND